MTTPAFGICPAPAHMLININKMPVRSRTEHCVAISLALAPTPGHASAAPATPCAHCESDV